MQVFYSLSRLIRSLKRRRGIRISALFTVLLLSITGNTITFYLFDRSINPSLTIWDSIWYSFISITTIGYGEIHAVSVGARIGTIVFIVILGLTTFTTVIGVSIDWIVDLRHKERRGMGKSKASGHLVIVNFPSQARVRQIIEEYTRDPRHSQNEVVLVTDHLDELPFSIPNVTYVKGSPLEEETFQRANISQANQAIVLSSSYDDPRSDSLVASIAFLIEHLNPEVSLVVEAMDPKHNVLFNVSDRVSLVYTLQVANNLLVQEAQDPGVNLLTQAVTSNLTEIEETLASATVTGDSSVTGNYTSIAKKLLDNGVVLVGVVRDGNIKIGFNDLEINKGDGLVYISKNRYEWQDFQRMLI